MFLTSPNLSTLPHGFFTRKGGVSQGIYASLNCGPGSGDDKARVVENRQRVARALGGAEAKLMSLYQVHGSDVVTVTTAWRHSKKPKADAMVTQTPGMALGILTADCVPVLFADMEARVIGAAHSGWKGTLADIGTRTVEAMCALGAKRSSIVAAIGPCIGQQSYEVDALFRDRFLAADKGLASYFIPGDRKEHFLFDIRGCVRELLGRAGINTINTLENDTYIEEDAFFSFRRTTHRQESDYGRQISAIMLPVNL